jgi:drug/metabolite transporter (DMT)-like permease
MYTGQFRWRLIAILLVLALIWGANWAIVKKGSRELPPLFMAGFRSLAASLCLFLRMRAKGILQFPSKKVALFTPLFGVFISGVLIPGESISRRLLLALVFVCIGMLLVNRRLTGKI